MAAEMPLQLAAEAMATGDSRAAAASLEKAVSTAPDLAPAHELLGVLFFGALDDYPRARRHLERSYRLCRRAGDLRGGVRSAIAHVAPWPLVAKVSALSSRPAGAAALRTELEVALHLQRAGRRPSRPAQRRRPRCTDTATTSSRSGGTMRTIAAGPSTTLPPPGRSRRCTGPSTPIGARSPRSCPGR